MKEKLGSLLNWSIGAVSLVLKNNLVVSAVCLVTGIIHLLLPKRALMIDALILTLLLLAYAIVSIVFVITNNKTIGKGRETTGGWVKGFLNGKRKDTVKTDRILNKDEAAQEFAKETHKHLQSFTEKFADKHEKTQSVSRILLLIFYLIILAVSIVLLLKQDIAVYINNIVIGLILIVDGVLSMISATSAKKERTLKFFVLTVIISVVSVILGVLFIVFSMKTGMFSMQLISAMMIIKSLGEFFIAFRNKEVLSSIQDTVTQIKGQGMETEVEQT